MKIGDCLTIRYGKDQKSVENINGKYPILGTGGVISRTNSFLYDKPSVLIGRKGTIDKPRYMDTPFWTVDTLFYSSINNNSIPKYIYYVFNTINWYKYNEASGVPSLAASTISSIKLNIPEKPEQQRIVSVLETWDEYLEILDKKIALKEQLKKGLMQQLLTGASRLFGFNGGWNEFRLQDVCTIRKGEQLNRNIMDNNGKFPVLNGGIGFSGYTDDYNTDENTISMSEGGNSCGHISFLTKKFWCGGHCYRIIPNSKIDKSFLYQYLKIKQKFIMKLRVGSGLPNIQKKDIDRLKLFVPLDINEQQAIRTILGGYDEELKLLEQKRKVIQNQKKYLLKNLITGKIFTSENLSMKGVN